jgi:chemotaxis signal transduction protein
MHEAVVDIESVDLLLFDIGREQFALPLNAVIAVHDGGLMHPHRSVDERSVGVLRMDGAFVPVFEPTRVLGVSRAGADPFVLMMGSGIARVGLLADFAEAALQVSLHTSRDLSGLGSMDGVVVGALRPADRWVTVLEAKALVDALLAVPSSHAA